MRRCPFPLEQIDSFFGFTEASALYGGRFFAATELSRYDVRSLYRMNINVRLPLTVVRYVYVIYLVHVNAVFPTQV